MELGTGCGKIWENKCLGNWIWAKIPTTPLQEPNYNFDDSLTALPSTVICIITFCRQQAKQVVSSDL